MPAISSHSTDTVDESWDGPANKTRVKTDQNPGYFSRIFAWRDPEGDPRLKTSYKFIHHQVGENGEPGPANVRACITGIAVLNGARGGTVIPEEDVKGVYNHLARHLRDADREPPELKREEAGTGMERRSSDEVELRAEGGGDDQLVIAGQAVVYNQLSVPIGPGFREKIIPGAFADSLKKDVVALWNHDTNLVLGRTGNGTLQLTDTDTALEFRLTLPDTQWGRDAWESIRRRDVQAVSFGFQVLEDKWEKGTPPIRQVLKGEIVEISPVVFPAYPQTTVSAREVRRHIQPTVKKGGTKMEFLVGQKPTNLREKLEERKRLLDEARRIMSQGNDEGRLLAADELEQVERLLEQVSILTQEIEGEERILRAQSRLAEMDARTSQALQALVGGQDRLTAVQAEEEQRRWRQYLVYGLPVEELRGLQADSDTAGGFLVPPETFVAALIKGIDNLVIIRQLATKYTLTKSDSLGVPALEADVSDADWTSEVGAVSEDTAMLFGKRQLRPQPLSKLVKVSNKLLRSSAVDPEALVRDRLVYKFAVTEEKAYLSGNGSGQPLGVFTPSDNGIPTGRDVSEGNTASSPTFDGLIAAKYALKGGYWPRAAWIFHRDILKLIAKLKDQDGQYIWRESVRVGEPSTILGLPVYVSEYAPNTIQASAYVGIIGDFSYYWIADALDIQIQRLVELYAANNQVGFIARREVDGMPVLAEAFARVKLAAG